MTGIPKQESRYFKFIKEKITLELPDGTSKKLQTGADDGCWLALNSDDSTHIVQGNMTHPKGWRVIERNLPGGLVLAEKNIVAVIPAPEGEFELDTLDGTISYNNTDGGYIVFNTFLGWVDSADKWFLPKSKFDQKYKLDVKKTEEKNEQ